MNKDTNYKTASRLVKLGNVIAWYKNQHMKSIGLTSSQSEAIQYILRNQEDKPITAADLMKNLELSQSTVAGIIRRLEQKGLIKCTVNPSDKRISIITVTRKGFELESELQKTAIETERILLSGISDEDQKKFNQLLQTALDNMNQVRNKS